MNEKTSTDKLDVDTFRRHSAQVAKIEASALFGGAREVVLLHNGEIYRLRVTQNGKLILTK